MLLSKPSSHQPDSVGSEMQWRSHLTPYTLHLKPYTSYLTPHTLHLTPYTLHLTSQTLQTAHQLESSVAQQHFQDFLSSDLAEFEFEKY